MAHLVNSKLELSQEIHMAGQNNDFSSRCHGGDGEIGKNQQGWKKFPN